MIDDPKIGECVRRKDDRRAGRVVGVGTPESPVHVRGMREGLTNEIVVEYSPGYTTICTRGPFFWTRWERIDIQAMAQAVMREGLR
jgi:hypothetical protein